MSTRGLKDSYEQCRIPYRFNVLVDDYIRMRRSHKAESSPDVPILAAKLADLNHLHRYEPGCGVGDRLCFERDWSFRDPKPAANAISPATSAENEASAPPATKKRKLRDAKSVSLDSVLGSL